MEQQNFTDTQTKINIKSKQMPKQSLKIEKKITADKHHEHQLNFGKQTKCDDCDSYVKKTSRNTLNLFLILITITRKKLTSFISAIFVNSILEI